MKLGNYVLLLVFVVLVVVGLYFAKNMKSKPKQITIRIDGSSTVYPITEAVAEEFKKKSDAKIIIGVSGTGGGMKKFAKKETHISNASRPIKDKEKNILAKNGIKYHEFEIAYDGLAVVVNKNNNWVDSLTIKQLNMMFKSGSTVKTWKDVNPDWPDETIKFYIPGAASGTFDFFTKKVNGKVQDSRSENVVFSEDDHVLTVGVSGDKNAIGYFGLAYVDSNVKLIAVEGIIPDLNTVSSREYPLARPLFIYVNQEYMKDKRVYDFVKFYIENAPKLSKDVGYTPLPNEKYESILKNYFTK